MTDTLKLSKTEKQNLIRFYKTDPAINEERPTRQPEDSYWYGVQIGDRMFDLAVSREEESGPEFCTVFECFIRNGEWQTDMTRDWFLSEAAT